MVLTVAERPPLREVGGAFRVGASNVTLETVLWAFQEGATPEAIVEEYPSLALADVYAAVAYYLRHRDEVETYLRAQAEAYQSTVESIQREYPQADLVRRRRQRTTSR
jgi:uncharacterized protein (DUF433 family)